MFCYHRGFLTCRILKKMEMHCKMPSYYNCLWFGSVASELKWGKSIIAATAQAIRKAQCKYFHSKSEELCGARVTKISLFPTTPIQLKLWRIVISGQIFLAPQTFPSSFPFFPPCHPHLQSSIQHWNARMTFLMFWGQSSPLSIIFYFWPALRWNDFQQASFDFRKWKSRL